VRSHFGSWCYLDHSLPIGSGLRQIITVTAAQSLSKLEQKSYYCLTKNRRRLWRQLKPSPEQRSVTCATVSKSGSEIYPRIAFFFSGPRWNCPRGSFHSFLFLLLLLLFLFLAGCFMARRATTWGMAEEPHPGHVAQPHARRREITLSTTPCGLRVEVSSVPCHSSRGSLSSTAHTCTSPCCAQVLGRRAGRNVPRRCISPLHRTWPRYTPLHPDSTGGIIQDREAASTYQSVSGSGIGGRKSDLSLRSRSNFISVLPWRKNVAPR
jgi:hypothetical protein